MMAGGRSHPGSGLFDGRSRSSSQRSRGSRTVLRGSRRMSSNYYDSRSYYGSSGNLTSFDSGGGFISAGIRGLYGNDLRSEGFVLAGVRGLYW